MSLYQFFLFLHILAVVVWIGGGIAVSILAFRAQRTGDLQVISGAASDAEWLGQRVFMPAAIVVLGAGLALISTGHWTFDPLWIKLGFAGIILSAVTGAAFLGPQSGKVKQLIAENADRSAIDQRIARVLLVARIDLVILVAVILDMVVKPGS
jgi:uncharacterized membrane protein